jgi:hypothetical protein
MMHSASTYILLLVRLAREGFRHSSALHRGVATAPKLPSQLFPTGQTSCDLIYAGGRDISGELSPPSSILPFCLPVRLPVRAQGPLQSCTHNRLSSYRI